MKKPTNDDIEPHVFDQTNGLVDLGSTTEAKDPEEERNNARRLSSLGALGVAYGNGTR